MTHRVCRFQGCFKRLNSTADICPSCAIKERRRKSRASRKNSVICEGVQTKFDIYATEVSGTYTTRDSPTVPFGERQSRRG